MDLNTLFQVVAEKAHLIRQVLFYSGLALVAGALLSIIHARWTRKPLKRRQRVSLLLLLIVGALLSFSTQFGLYRLPAGGFTIMRRAEPVEAEEQVDQAALDQLKTARFHGKESALGGKGSWPQWLGPTRWNFTRNRSASQLAQALAHHHVETTDRAWIFIAVHQRRPPLPNGFRCNQQERTRSLSRCR